MFTAEQIDAVIREIDAEIAAAASRLEELRLERRGVEAIKVRLRGPAREGQSPGRTSVRAGGNAAYVADLLSEAADSLSLQDIEARSKEQGNPLNNDQVRSAVTYLRRKDLAENVGRGRWRLVDSYTDAASPEAPGLAVLPAPLQDGAVEAG